MKNKKQENKKVLQSDSDLSEKELKTKELTTEESQSNSSPEEIGGRTQGLEPTRYGDWEFKGRCIDF